MATKKKTNNEALLIAGGLLPPKTKVSKSVPTFKVSARVYSHKALGDRPIIRLTPDDLGKADDLEMEVLGFEKAKVEGPLALQRRRSLGFPGWALINDPKHARYALEVVKEFKNAVRRAASKPGHAKEAIDDIGKRLSRSVPHFLPSFYEETGRAFLAAGSTNYAATYFGKAREAESVHGLKIDEELRRQTFLEFALAGAVTVKALTDYAKELAKAHNPKEAYHHFRLLCVKRTLGGLPPWGTMARELKRLIKSAKLDVAKEEEAFLCEILEAPALSSASGDFWKSYGKTLKKMAQGDIAIRARLLEVFPKVGNEKFDSWWLEFLDECGALDDFCALEVKGKAKQAREKALKLELSESRAAWFSRLVKHCYRTWRSAGPPEPVFHLLRRASKRLIADKEAISCSGRYNRLDLDLLDLALELKIPIVDPVERTTFDLSMWAKSADKAERGRDPIHVWNDERFQHILAKAVDNTAGTREFEEVAQGKKGLAQARENWLLRNIESLDGEAVPSLENGLEKLESATSAATYQEFPKAYEKLKKKEVSKALTRNLQLGILDELGWPLLEETIAKLSPKGKAKLYFSSTWPHLIVSDGLKVVVISAQGKEKEFELQLPQKAQLLRMRYIGGEIVVLFRNAKGIVQGCWTNAPKKKFSLDRYMWGVPSVGGFSCPIKNGVFEGSERCFVGDTDLPDRSKMYSDGETFWVLTWDGSSQKLLEVDPQTGETGRYSMPKFIEDYAEDEWWLGVPQCSLYPLPKGLKSSPLGSKDGLYGFRARKHNVEQHRRDVLWRCESIDGQTFETNHWRGLPKSFVKLPGAPPIAVREHRSYSPNNNFTMELVHAKEGYDLAILDQDCSAYRRATPFLLPVDYWHFLTVRDAKASAKLRKIKEKDVLQLLAVAEASLLAKEGEDKSLEKIKAACAKYLGKGTNEKLLLGVAGIVRYTALQREKLQEMKLTHSPDNAADTSGPPVTDQDFNEALGDVFGHCYGNGEFSTAIRDIVALWQGKHKKSTPTQISWGELVGNMGALAFLSTTAGAGEKERNILFRIMECWATTPMAQEPEKFRVASGCQVDWALLPIDNDDSYYGLGEWKKSLYYLKSGYPKGYLIEYALDGKFQDLPGISQVEDEWICSQDFGSPERIKKFLALAKEKGTTQWQAEIATRLRDLTGLSLAEASLLWVGMKGMRKYAQNFMPKDVRTMLGLKVSEAAVARQTLRSMSRQQKLALFKAAIPDNLEKLWQPLGDGPDDEDAPVNRLAKKWNELRGKRAVLPKELVTLVSKELCPEGRPTETLAVFAEPADCEKLRRDGQWAFSQIGHPVCEESKVFHGAFLSNIVSYIPFLFSYLPVGDSLRDNIPRVIELARDRMANPKLILGPMSFHCYDDDVTTVKFVKKLGGKDFKPIETKGRHTRRKIVVARDCGDVIAVATDWQTSIGWRPALVKDWAKLKRLAASCYDTPTTLMASQIIVSQSFTDFVERLRNTPVPKGAYEANPLLSVPELVQQAAKKLKLSKEAAAYYLQLLTLANPTDKNIRLWNDWKPATFKKATKELLDKKLVLEAKRARAGRKVFLPGGWEAFKKPLPPMETWKLGLYQMVRSADGRISVPLERALPLQPLHKLFASAWQRVSRGDLPKYEEVS